MLLLFISFYNSAWERIMIYVWSLFCGVKCAARRTGARSYSAQTDVRSFHTGGLSRLNAGRRVRVCCSWNFVCQCSEWWVQVAGVTLWPPWPRPLTPCRHGRSGLSTQCKHLYFFWACVLVVCMWFSLCYTPAHPAGWGVFSPRVDACGCSRLQQWRLKEAVWLFVFSWGAIACHTLWYHDVAELFTDFTTKD